MNILPFVAIFLVLLATLSYTSLDKGKLLHYEKEAALGYMRADQSLLKKIHKTAFEKIPAQKDPLDEKTPAKTKKKPSGVTRGSHLVKMNLTPLFQEGCPDIVKATFFNLLKTYYGHSSFLEPRNLDLTIKSFIKYFIESGKEKIHQCTEEKEPLSSIKLSQFHPKLKLENYIFYKMLKGTHLYNLEQKDGYPPFEDVFYLAEQKPLKILHFPSMPSLMLKALFGEKMTESILEKEAASASNPLIPIAQTLSEQELLDLLHKKFPSDTHLHELITLLDFVIRHKIKDKLVAYDAKTCIQVEKELRAN
jgi:hypothetical protein